MAKISTQIQDCDTAQSHAKNVVTVLGRYVPLCRRCRCSGGVGPMIAGRFTRIFSEHEKVPVESVRASYSSQTLHRRTPGTIVSS